MTDFTPIENEVLGALKEIGATTEDKKKTADDIAKKCNRPKSMVTNTLMMLVQKNAVKRIVREKASGYFLLSTPPK